jgi:hypothetical protein
VPHTSIGSGGKGALACFCHLLCEMLPSSLAASSCSHRRRLSILGFSPCYSGYVVPHPSPSRPQRSCRSLFPNFGRVICMFPFCSASGARSRPVTKFAGQCNRNPPETVDADDPECRAYSTITYWLLWLKKGQDASEPASGSGRLAHGRADILIASALEQYMFHLVRSPCSVKYSCRTV